MQSSSLSIFQTERISFSSLTNKTNTVYASLFDRHEFMLIYIKRGCGKYLIDNATLTFNPKDVLLLGPKMLQNIRFRRKLFDSLNTKSTEIYVVNFSRNFCGEAFLDLPECKDVRLLLSRSDYGLKLEFAGQDLISCFNQMVDANEYQKLFLLIKVLGVVAAKGRSSTINDWYQIQNKLQCDTRMSKVIEYIIENFRNDISLHKLADIASMNPTAFCRYFKSETKQSPFALIRSMKIDFALKLIRSGDMSMKQVAFEAGFLSLKSFHENFKKVTGTTPLTCKLNKG